MLYHIEINWPKQLPVVFNNIEAVPTKHAIERAKEKGIRLNRVFTGHAFECEYINGRLTKLALRCRYSATHDLCIVLSNTGLIITCWLNRINDMHKTLDKSRYIA